jgi:hypothetical protein
MMLISVVSILVFPVVFLVDMSFATKTLISSFAFAIGTASALGFIFIPKMYALLSGKDVDKNFQIIAMKKQRAMQPATRFPRPSAISLKKASSGGFAATLHADAEEIKPCAYTYLTFRYIICL